MRTCTTCGVSQQEEEFRVDTVSGYMGRKCRICRNKRIQKTRKNTRAIQERRKKLDKKDTVAPPRPTRMSPLVWGLLNSQLGVLTRYANKLVYTMLPMDSIWEGHDILQDAILDMLAAPNQPAATAPDVLYWAFRILRNRTIKVAEKVRSEILLAEAIRKIPSQEYEDTLFERIEATIPLLTKQQQQLLLLRLLGKNYQEVAAIIGISLSATKSGINGATTALRRRLLTGKK